MKSAKFEMDIARLVVRFVANDRVPITVYEDAIDAVTNALYNHPEWDKMIEYVYTRLHDYMEAPDEEDDI